MTFIGKRSAGGKLRKERKNARWDYSWFEKLDLESKERSFVASLDFFMKMSAEKWVQINERCLILFDDTSFFIVHIIGCWMMCCQISWLFIILNYVWCWFEFCFLGSSRKCRKGRTTWTSSEWDYCICLFAVRCCAVLALT